MISDRLFTIREEGDAVVILDQTLLPHEYARVLRDTLAQEIGGVLELWRTVLGTD